MSDLSVFHRIDDPGTLTIRRFLSLAARLPAYRGALALALEPHRPAEVASAAGVPAGRSGALSAGGDTPPEVIAAIKKQQFAERYKIDPSNITWDNDAIYRELVG